MEERIRTVLAERLARIEKVKHEIMLLKAVIPLLAEDDPLTPVNGNGRKEWP